MISLQRKQINIKKGHLIRDILRRKACIETRRLEKDYIIFQALTFLLMR
jgi:hypothetical protein